ncbi:MAG: DUF3048 domain-containing protein [Clostridiales bacterium]|nr:DUF3048 domain-containing protein [Clostridiales bacterium]
MLLKIHKKDRRKGGSGRLMKKLIPILLVLLLFITACNNSRVEAVPPATASPTISIKPSYSPTPSPTPSLSPSPTPTPTPYNGPVNPLTGLPTTVDLSGKRPLAIMLNNIKEALPQHGTASADIIYETLAEGGITRMLAIYQSTDNIDRIGSIRSARPYFLDLAQGLDAIYIHAGGSPQAYEAISSRGVCNIDGVRGNYEIFYRDRERAGGGYAYEHTLFSTGELLDEYLPTYNIRTDHQEGYAYAMRFSEQPDSLSGLAAQTINVHFSNYKTGVFTYDELSMMYKVSQYGAEYKDGNTGDQVSVKNVLVLHAPVSRIPNDTEGRLSIDLVGSGTGLFACEGKYIPVIWSKDGYSSSFLYTLEDGTELSFGRGTSYICIIPENEQVDIS